MATITREQIGTQHDKINVKLDKNDYWPQFEKGLKQYAKQAQVPGFRKGMVPAGMVRKMYGQALFQEEVVRTAGRELEEFLKKEQLSIFAQPMMLPSEKRQALDMNNPQEVEFAFEIGVRPDFKIPALEGSGQTINRYKISVSDKLLDDETERISRRLGKVEEQESVTGKNDIIYATFTATDATGNPLEGGSKNEEVIMFEKLPVKLQEQLMGKKKDDTILIRPADIATAEELPVFMKDSLKADMSQADFYFELLLTKVSQLSPKAVDHELFAQVFPNDMITEESVFRNKLREELSKEFDRIANDRVNNEIFETLVHTTPIELPQTFLKRYMREGGEKRLSNEEVEQQYGQFDHNLRWQLITDQIMREHGVSVTRQDLEQDIKTRVLAYFGMDAEDTDEAPWIDSYMQKVMKDEKMVNETYQRLTGDRIFSFLQTKFNIQEQEISEEEFFKLPHPHAAPK